MVFFSKGRRRTRKGIGRLSEGRRRNNDRNWWAQIQLYMHPGWHELSIAKIGTSSQRRARLFKSVKDWDANLIRKISYRYWRKLCDGKENTFAWVGAMKCGRGHDIGTGCRTTDRWIRRGKTNSFIKCSISTGEQRKLEKPIRRWWKAHPDGGIRLDRAWFTQ